MIRSRLQEIIEEILNEEKIEIGQDEKEKFSSKVRETEEELDDSLGHIFDKLRQDLRELNNNYKLNLNDSEIDKITDKIKEKIYKNY
jgi:molybdopterin converting factor small subunit